MCWCQMYSYRFAAALSKIQGLSALHPNGHQYHSCNIYKLNYCIRYENKKYARYKTISDYTKIYSLSLFTTMNV